MICQGSDASHSGRAQVGIGTLVIFIAMVLVATIGAGVLIDTAGLLQTKAENTGQESTAEVTNRLMVVNSLGSVTGGGDKIRLDSSDLEPSETNAEEEFVIQSGQELRNLQMDALGCSNTPYFLIIDGVKSDHKIEANDDILVENTGDGEIRFTHLAHSDVITTASAPVSLRVDACNEGSILFSELTGDSDDFLVDETGTAEARFVEEYLGWINLTVRRGPGASDIDLRDATVSVIGPNGAYRLTHTSGTANSTRFGTNPLQDTDSVLKSGEQATISLNAAKILSQPGFSPGDEVTITIVTQSGAQTAVTVTVPGTFTKDEVSL